MKFKTALVTSLALSAVLLSSCGNVEKPTAAETESAPDLEGVTIYYRADCSPYGYGQELSNPEAVARTDLFIRTMNASGSGKDEAPAKKSNAKGGWFDIKLSDGREVHKNNDVFNVDGKFYTWKEVDKYDPDFIDELREALSPDTDRLLKEQWNSADDEYRAANPDPDTL